MLINNGDGSYTTGPFDVLCILHNRETGRFHPAFFEERPFPGLSGVEVKIIRLRSSMHHTEGAATLEVALMQVAELVKTLKVPPTNIWLRPKPWNGDIGIVWVVNNWLADPVAVYNNLEAALRNPAALLEELKRGL